MTKGETPMEKNVSVTDENGIRIGTTYPRRARGLINKGRAIRIGESTIRLIARESKSSEEKSMPDIKEPKIDGTVDLAYILKQIEQVRSDDEHIKNTIESLKTASGDQASALGKLVHEREETNRVILDFYREIYENMNSTAHVLKILEKIADNGLEGPVGEITNLIYKLLGIEKPKS